VYPDKHELESGTLTDVVQVLAPVAVHFVQVVPDEIFEYPS